MSADGVESTQARELRVERETVRVLKQLPSRRFAHSDEILKRLNQRVDAKDVQTGQGSLFGTARIRLRNGRKRFDESHAVIVRNVADAIALKKIDLSKIESRVVLDHELRSLPVSLRLKRAVRRELRVQASKKRSRRSFVRERSRDWQKTCMFGAVRPFQSVVDHVTSVHGSAVAAYFTFLRWLLLLNMPVCVISIAFVVIPGILRGSCLPSVQFSVTDMLTGAGWFDVSPLYYGYYTVNTSKNATLQFTYDMQLAYFFGLWTCYLLAFILALIKLLYAYRKSSARAGVDATSLRVAQTFGAWKFRVTAQNEASRQSVQLLAEFRKLAVNEECASRRERVALWARRGVVMVLVLALIAAASFLVYLVADLSVGDVFENYTSVFDEALNIQVWRESLQGSILRDGLVPLTVSTLHFLLPPLLVALVKFQAFTAYVETCVSLCCDVVLKVTTVVTVVAFWSGLVKWQSRRDVVHDVCWETLFGEQLYRMILFDLFVFVAFTAVVEFGRSALAKCIRRVGRPRCNTIRDVLHLIYLQCLLWLSLFYSPLMFVLALPCFLIIFYVKWASSIRACASPARFLWRAAQLDTVFSLVLVVVFVVASAVVAFTSYSLPPSTSCGPFIDYNSTFDVFSALSVVTWLSSLVHVLTSQGAVVSFLALLTVGVYFQRKRAMSWKRVLESLQDELRLRVDDRRHLLLMVSRLVRYRVFSDYDHAAVRRAADRLGAGVTTFVDLQL